MITKFLFLVTFLACTCSYAQEWTQLRGPNGTGHSSATTIPVSFSAADYNWIIPIEGEGYSSPVLWGDRLFLTRAQSREDGNRYVQCFRTSDGKALWETAFTFAPYHLHQHNSFASSTPVVDANSVYIIWTDGGNRRKALALDHDGNERWQVELGNFDGQHGSGASPLLYKEVLIVPNDGRNDDSFIVGLEKTTGKIIWRKDRSGSDKACYATPVLHQVAGQPDQVVAINTHHGMTGFDPLTGKTIWEEPLDFGVRTVGSPVWANGVFFVTGGSGGAGKASAAVIPGTASTPAKTAYTLKRGLPYVPSTLAYKDLLYLWADGGILTCIKSATGETVYTERVGGKYYSSPILIGNKIYCGDREGTMFVVEAGPEFKLLAENAIGEGMYATPAVHHGVMYVRTFKHLFSVGGK